MALILGVGVLIAAAVGVALTLGVGVMFAIAVGVALTLGVGVMFAIAVGVALTLGVGVMFAIAVGVALTATTSSGVTAKNTEDKTDTKISNEKRLFAGILIVPVIPLFY